jgi:mono/diheme cytochrome c family protein
MRSLMIAASLLATAGDLLAQPAASKTRTTLSGVYTAAQATRGKDVYAGMCRSCHMPESHTGLAFEQTWAGKPLSELIAFVSQQMPKNDPGALSPQEYADVVAYVLTLNAMPAGKTELPALWAASDSIRIAIRKPAAKKDTIPIRKGTE